MLPAGLPLRMNRGRRIQDVLVTPVCSCTGEKANPLDARQGAGRSLPFAILTRGSYVPDTRKRAAVESLPGIRHVPKRKGAHEIFVSA